MTGGGVTTCPSDTWKQSQHEVSTAAAMWRRPERIQQEALTRSEAGVTEDKKDRLKAETGKYRNVLFGDE